MEQQVIFRDRQEIQYTDFNGLQQYADEALQHVTIDAITGDMRFTGGMITINSLTEVTVAAMRFYNNGSVYAATDETVLNVFNYLPLVTKKIVAVVVWGQEVDTQVEPRDFLVNLTTGTTEPKTVPMLKLRQVNINLLPGTESVAPQIPSIQSEVLAIGLIYLASSGIERVEMLDINRLPNLLNHEHRTIALETWRSKAEPKISSIATDLSALSELTRSMTPRSTAIEMAGDIARLKAQLNLPNSYSNYEADYFGDTEFTNAAAVNYAARIDNGLLFPFASQASANLALFNPYDNGVKRSETDLVLPAYDEVARIQTTGYSGDISISQYQVQTHVMRSYVVNHWAYRYGWNWNYYPSWYNSWYWNYYGYAYNWYGYYGYYYNYPQTYYKLDTATESYNGAIIAQSFLVANAMWLTKIGLFFTQKGNAGDVVVSICETDGGKPDLQKTVAKVTLAQSDIKAYPVETSIPVLPVALEAGKRYALVLITGGDHRVATVSGNNYKQGTLFFGTDGDYFTGDLTKDLMFSLYSAQFKHSRTEVVLGSVSLAGGIADLQINAPQIIPSGTQFHYEIQVSGKWYPLHDGSNRLATLPDIVPIRAVMLGTADIAPAFVLTANAITASRPADAVLHESKAINLPSASASITVQVVAAQWDQANHSLNCTIKDSNGATFTPAATVVKSEPDNQAKRFDFTFTTTGDDAYTVKLTGTKTQGAAPFVIVERTFIAI